MPWHRLGFMALNTHKTSPLRAAIYARISNDKEGKSLGVARQIEACETYCDDHGYDVVAILKDDDISAYAGKKPRPDYQRLIAMMLNGDLDVVVAWHTDRLHRDDRELFEYIDYSCTPRSLSTGIAPNDIATETIMSGIYDLSTSMSRGMVKIASAMAMQKVEHDRENLLKQKREAAKAGKRLGGAKPFGYDLVKKDKGIDASLMINTVEAEMINSAIDDLLIGRSVRSIMKQWNESGVLTTRRKRSWDHASFKRMLCNPVNAGLIIRDGEEIKGQWEPIVTLDRFRMINSLLHDPSRRTNNKGSARRWLGSGIYRCECGHAVKVNSTGKGGKAYICPGCYGIARDVTHVDQLVIEWMRQDFFNHPRSNEMLPADDQGELARLEASKQTQQMIMESAMADSYRLKAGSARKRIADKMADDAEKELESIQAKIDSHYEQTSAGLIMASDDPFETWIDDETDLDLRRDVLNAACTVILMKRPKGRPKGWRKGMPYFDKSDVVITPRS